MNGRTLFELIGTVDEEMLEQSEWTAGKKRRPSVKKALLLTAAVVAALAATVTAAAVSEGTNALRWILAAFDRAELDRLPDQGVIQAEIDQGQWIWLNGDNVAVIVPESPVRIMLSADGGITWRESVVQGSDEMEFWGEVQDEVQYYGGYIGFFGESGGYLVLTAGVRMNNQPMRIYLTGDGGATWAEIGSPYEAHSSVLTGAGFSTPEIGFISYRYYEDFGPDIWWTRDGGESWEKLPVVVPEQYAAELHGFTPGTPVFDGKNGIYPITYVDQSTPDYAEETIYMYSGDYGLTWTFEPQPPRG